MHCFVPVNIHTHKCAKATPKGAGPQKDYFRNAPFMSFGFFLVNKHKQEGYCIDYNKIGNDIIHKNVPFWRGIMKKLCVLVCAVLLLTGCAAKQTFETVNDHHP